MKRIKSNNIISADRIVAGYLYFEGDKIVEVTDREYPCERTYDAGACYVSAGFIDLHSHGGGGASFDGTPEEIAAAADFHLNFGTTSICPTVSAAPFDVMKEAVKNIKAAKDEKMAKANILGAHLEGPYLSGDQCGAQCADFITRPEPLQYQQLIQEYGDTIVRWTYAPEKDTDGAFCRYLTQNKIIASAGHTNALFSDMQLAKQSGCSLITHLYSCTSTVTRDHGFRRLGVIESAFLEDDLFVEIIADGKHLPPELIRLILKIKGIDRVALITDSLHLAGTGVKRGKMQATDFMIEDGVCKLPDRSAFAGSIATADQLIRVMVNDVGLPMQKAVKMLTAVPAEILGLSKGLLAAGRDADVIIFDQEINMQKVFVMGQEV